MGQLIEADWGFVMRRAMAGSLLVLPLLVATVAPAPASAGSRTSVNACGNNVTGVFADIGVTLAGTANGDAPTVTLSGASFEVVFPGAVLVAGYNLGLITVGFTEIPATLSTTIEGPGSVEGSHTVTDVALTGQTTITDPDGTPGTGDESATDLFASAPLPDTTWTPSSSSIDFRSGGSTILADLGTSEVTFTCSIGSSAPAGCATDLAVDCTGFRPAPAVPFERFATMMPLPTTGFFDVPDHAPHAIAVRWLSREEITTGTSPAIYSPDGPATRAQVATFLWRYEGRPEPASVGTPFTDVATGRFFSVPVAWLAETEITTGTSPTMFAPDLPVTRAQMAVLLWRYSGRPETASLDTPFTDVPPGASYAKAVAWLAGKGVTTGTSPTTFSPDEPVTRAQAAVFLWRLAGEPVV